MQGPNPGCLYLYPPVSVFEEETVLGCNHFWGEGYRVDTVRLDADMIRKYVPYPAV